MPATLRSFTTASLAAASTITPAVPTHQAGDILIVFAMGDNPGTSLAPDQSGWTQLQNTVPGQTVQAWWYRTASASEPSTYSFSYTPSGATGNLGAVFVSVNADGDTFNTITSSTIGFTEATATGTTPALAGAANNTVLFAAFIADDNETIANPPAGMTQVAFVDMSASELVVYWETNVGTETIQRSIVWGTTTDVAQGTVLLAYTPGTIPSGPRFPRMFGLPFIKNNSLVIT